MPRESFPAGIRTVLWAHNSIATAAATVSADFSANTLATIAGGTAGFIAGIKAQITKIRFRVGDADFVGGGGTLTFELRKNSATGTAIASITIPLATALRGAVIESLVTAANGSLANIRDTDSLFLVRLATGTAFTTGAGVFEIEAWQKPQGRV